MKIILLTFILMLSQIAASHDLYSEDVKVTHWKFPHSYWQLTMVDREDVIDWDHRYPTRKKCLLGGMRQMQESLGIWMTQSPKVWLGFLCTPQRREE